jgi:Ca2+-binding EF-hand superfamily protein
MYSKNNKDLSLQDCFTIMFNLKNAKGEKINEKELKEKISFLFKKLDKDNTGKIEFQKFEYFMKNINKS